MTRALVLASLLAALPSGAVEGAVSAELTVGRQFALNASFELSPVLDRLWLVAGYGLLKSPDVAATETTPRVTSAASHLISAGLDVSPHRMWVLSALGLFSPKASDSQPLNPLALPQNRITLASARQSAGANLLLAFDTAGLSDFELSADAGAAFTWNRLSTTLSFGSLTRFAVDDLLVTRPQLGVSVRVKDRVTLGLRAGYTFYCAVDLRDPASRARGCSPDPMEAGRLHREDLVFSEDDLQRLADVVSALNYRLSGSVRRDLGSVETMFARLASFDAVSGYPYAPVRFDLKASVQAKFSRLFSAQLAWTYLRYVPGQGFGHVLALKGTFRFGSGWRAWLAGALQLDEPLDFPATRTPTDPKLAGSGHLSVGGELAF